MNGLVGSDKFGVPYGGLTNGIQQALGLPTMADVGGVGIDNFMGGGADPAAKVQGLYGNILEHLEKIAENPEDQNLVSHWRTEIKGWAQQILDKANKVNLKRRPGAVDSWLERAIGVGSEDLQKFLRIGDIWTINPCLTVRDPLYQLQMCGSKGGA